MSQTPSVRLVRIYFLLESLNSFATTLFFYYVYFFTEAKFGFTNKQNLALAASLGLCYGVSSMIGGRLSQRRGYVYGLKAGIVIMAASIGAGALIVPLWVQIGLLYIGHFGMALTWPALEALVSEGQPTERLQRNIGIYNILWAAFGAVAYFCGGAIIRAFGFRAMFVVPLAVLALECVILWKSGGKEERGEPQSKRDQSLAVGKGNLDESAGVECHGGVSPQTFLKMAWLANPFAYLAINTVVALLPGVAQRLELSVMWAGFAGSVWQFVRTGAFALLWFWDGWHYRFRWLAGAYIAMSLSFVGMLIAPNTAVLLSAEVVFGLGLALIYYSSLYYSMHVGDTKGEHGGMHEAMIGAGCCAGPAVGAFTLHYLPEYASSGTLAVGGLLLTGLAGLIWLRFARGPRPKPNERDHLRT